jgi:hypothetical protein
MGKNRLLRSVAAVLVLSAIFWARAEVADPDPASELLRYLPSRMHAVVSVNWKRVVAQPSFPELASGLRLLLGAKRRMGVFFDGSRLDLAKIQGIAAGFRFTERERLQELVVLIQGEVDRGALEQALEAALRLKPFVHGGVRFFENRRGDLAFGFVKPNLFAIVTRSALDALLAVVAGTGEPVTATPFYKQMLSRFDARVLAVGGLLISPELRARFEKKEHIPAPVFLAGNLEESGTTITHKGAIAFEDEAARERGEAVVQKALAEIPRGIGFLLRRVPRPLTERLLAAVRSLRASPQGKELAINAELHFDGVAKDFLEFSTGLVFPKFDHLVRRAKTAEARLNLRRIAAGAVRFYEETKAGPDGQPLPRSFPPSVGPTPGGSPCSEPGHRFPGDPKAWEHPAWQTLGFSVSGPHYYRYTFLSEGTGESSRFTARANGDLDCNGVWSTFEIQGTVGADGKVKSTSGIYRNLPFE